MIAMENKRIWSIIRTIALSLQLIAQILCVLVVLQLNMLPDKYVVLFIVSMAVLAAGMGLLMFIRVNDKIGLWRKIVSGILAGIILCGCVLVSKVAWDAHQLMDGVTDDPATTHNTYVLVLNENPAHALKDTKGYTFGAVENYDVEHTERMVAAVEKETGEKTALKYYQQAAVMVDALYQKEVDALIMNSASVSLLIERAEYADFLSKVRILNTLSYEEKEPDQQVNNGSVMDPFIVLISGSDTRSKLLRVSRSDVNILAVVNPTTKQILLLNTPRDYYVPNPAGKGKLDKLTHCGNYGVKCSVQALEGLYNTQIGYYCQINFTGFEKLIDAIGGVTVYADESFRTVEGSYISSGENKLDGKTALQFARERYNVSGGDNARGKNQMKVIKAVIDKMTSSKTLISNYTGILNSLEGMFVTSFTTEQMSSIVKMQLNDMASWNIQSFAVTGKGDYQETYSAPGEQLYVMWPNEDTVQHASKLIEKVFNGETITAEDTQLPK